MLNLDFSPYVLNRTRDFTGREWVFQVINDWLADPDGSRFFLLKGEPGSGKTAISARLSQFSQGLPTPNRLSHLTQGYLSAIHFCSARDTTWIDPLVFAGSLATQLANRYPAYLKLLEDLQQEKHIGIDVKQTVKEVINGQVIGVVINVSGPSPESAFNRVVREPLNALLDGEVNEQVVILVDALDEALIYSGTPTIISLLAKTDQLSPQVRFLLTTRQEERVENQLLGVKELSLAIPGDQRNQDDIRRYIEGRLQNDLQLAKKAAQVETTQVTELVEAASHKAEGNFLYISFLLDAMANGLRSLTELNGLPIGLDWLYFDSLRRVVDLGKRDWFNEYRPLMGVLSVAQESLTLAQLQAFTKQSKSDCLEYYRNLQQFIEEVKPQEGHGAPESRYRFYHLSVMDFLHREIISIKENEGERKLGNTFYLPTDEWHKHMAKVCEQDNLSNIWDDIKRNPVEQGRRQYTRQYYITHLYQAQEWQRLFEVLDQVDYGKQKVHNDPSTRSYAQDLDLGRRAAAWEEWSVEEGISLLPYLWRYTLLRSSLTSWADNYPLAAFEALVLLRQHSEALSRAELLTKPDDQVRALLRIAATLASQAEWEKESSQLFMRAGKVAESIGNSEIKASMLITLGSELVRAQLGEQAKVVWPKAELAARTIEDPSKCAHALSKLGQELAKAQQWEQAEVICYTIEDSEMKAEVLSELGRVFAKAQQWERAEEIIHIIEHTWKIREVLNELSRELAKAGQWERAEATANKIKHSAIKAEALGTLGTELTRAQLLERAEVIWGKAEAAAHSIKDSEMRAKVLGALSGELARAQQWQRAKRIWEEALSIARRIEGTWYRAGYLSDIALELTNAQQREQAEAVWAEVERVLGTLENSNYRSEYKEAAYFDLGRAFAKGQQWERSINAIRHIKEDKMRVEVLSELSRELAKAGLPRQAEAVMAEMVAVIHGIEDSWSRAEVLSELCQELIRAQQWERARTVAYSIKDNYHRALVLSELGSALAEAQQWEQAEQVWTASDTAVLSIEGATDRAWRLVELGHEYAKEQQWERAEKVWTNALGVALSIETNWGREQVLEILSREFAQVQLREQIEGQGAELATRVLRFAIILGPETLCKLGQEWARAQQWEHAESIASAIEDPYCKGLLLKELGYELVKAQQWERAEEVWTEAQTAAHKVEDGEKRARVLGKLGVELVRAQQWEHAEEVWAEAELAARTIKDAERCIKVLSELDQERDRAKQWERAEALVYNIENIEMRTLILNELGRAFVDAQQNFSIEAIGYDLTWDKEMFLSMVSEKLAQAEQWKHAEAIARTIEASRLRARALIVLGDKLVEAQERDRAKIIWEEAEIAIRSIETSELRAELLSELGGKFAKVHSRERTEALWKEAEATAHSIKDDEPRARALSELAGEFAKMHRWKLAETLIHSIEKDNQRAQALVKLTGVLAMAGEYERLLHTVQHWWLQASTRDYAIQLLPMGNAFIPQKPEIGTAFCEAFTWVDNFLNG